MGRGKGTRPEEVRQANELIAQGLRNADIARLMNRGQQWIERIRAKRNKSYEPAEPHVPPDENSIAEWRHALSLPQDLTAALCGDPLPTRSELFRRQHVDTMETI